MVPVARKRYTNTRFLWPSRHTRAAACLSLAGFLQQARDELCMERIQKATQAHRAVFTRRSVHCQAKGRKHCRCGLDHNLDPDLH